MKTSSTARCWRPTNTIKSQSSSSRAQILEAYQRLLDQYSVACRSWVRVVYPAGLQDAALQPLPAPTATPTLADVNRQYQRALEMDVAVWNIGEAVNWGWTSKMSIPKYTGPLLFMPVAPPLPPLQNVGDPAYARLVAMTKKVDETQKAAILQQRIETGKQLAASRAWAAENASAHRNDSIDPRTGLSYPAPQQPQPVQRWCTQSGGGVVARVPC
ncbi:hypothetical protein [Ralstonia sp. UBA689]|uniref:hypothetical protein n=1 Tax=Ralstonia sp. UBA689 TaxID=1947373 RepID=UPI0025D42928|nr:hypothetical protein [Ralstonia sp. UBA689]